MLPGDDENKPHFAPGDPDARPDPHYTPGEIDHSPFFGMMKAMLVIGVIVFTFDGGWQNAAAFIHECKEGWVYNGREWHFELEVEMLQKQDEINKLPEEERRKQTQELLACQFFQHVYRDEVLKDLAHAIKSPRDTLDYIGPTDQFPITRIEE
jgi:hypothetical protein